MLFGLPFSKLSPAPDPILFSFLLLWFFVTNSFLSLNPTLIHSHYLLSPLVLKVLPGGTPPPFPFLTVPSPGRYTYEIAPVFVLMEEEVLKKLRELVGWSSGDGVFCPGT